MRRCRLLLLVLLLILSASGLAVHADETTWRTERHELVGCNFSLQLPEGYCLVNENTIEFVRSDTQLWTNIAEIIGEDYPDDVVRQKSNIVLTPDSFLRMDISTTDPIGIDQSALYRFEDSFAEFARSNMESNGHQEIEIGLFEYGGNSFLASYGQGTSLGKQVTYGYFYTIDSEGRPVSIQTYLMDRSTVEQVLSGLSSASTAATREEQAAGWKTYRLTHALNADGEICTPDEFGGELLMSLIPNGQGLLHGEIGTARFDWVDNGGSLTIGSDIQVVPDGDSLIYQYYDSENQAVIQLHFEPADDRSAVYQLLGTWPLEFTGEASEATEFLTQAGSRFTFNAGGTVSYGFDSELSPLVEILSAADFLDLGSWTALDDSLFILWSDSENIGEIEYEISDGMLKVSSPDESAALDLHVPVPIHYESPVRYAKFAGTWYAERDGKVCCWTLNVDGTAHYQLADALLEPHAVYESADYHWISSAEGINIFTSDGEIAYSFAFRQTPVYLNLLAELDGIGSVRLERSDSLAALLASAGEHPEYPLRDLLGVWDAESSEEGFSFEGQLQLNPDGTVVLRSVMTEGDVRDAKYEELTGCTWQLTDGGVLVSVPDGSSILFELTADGLLSEGFTFLRTADYSAWNGEGYDAPILVNYMDSGWVGVWQSTSSLDPYSEEIVVISLAADGAGEIGYRTKFNTTSVPIEWAPDSNGITLTPCEDLIYIPVLAGQEYTVSYPSHSDIHPDLKTPSHLIGLEKIGDYWASADEAGDETQTVVNYIDNGDGTATLTEYFNSAASIELPASVDSLTVTALADGLFEGQTHLTRVIIPNGVTAIGAGAFTNCTSLTDVVLPDSLLSIGANGFSGCISLQSIPLPGNLASIGNGCFSGCASLTEVSIPDGMTIIEANAFSNCSSLRSVQLPDSLLTIGSAAFFYCTSLEEISISDSLQVIGNEAFRACGSLNSIAIPASVREIGADAFIYCTSLQELTLTDGVSGIGSGAFANSGLVTLRIPGSVSTISSGAFSGCGRLEHIELCEGITSIGDSAFELCSALAEVALPEGLVSVGSNAFNCCDSLSLVTMPDSVEELGKLAFANNPSLRQVRISQGLKRIGDMAFLGCTRLESLWLPDGMEEVGSYLTEDSTELLIGGSASESAQLSGKIADAEDFVLETLADGTLRILRYTGSDASVTIPAAVDGVPITVIGVEAFLENTSLKSVVVPEGILEIGDKAFFGCSSLTDITLPTTLHTFGRFPFNNCPDLVIHAAAGAYAQEYAAGRNLKFSVVE